MYQSPSASPMRSPSSQRADVALVFVQVFLAECPRGVVMSGMLPYFSSLSPTPQAHMATAVSLFSLGRMLASLPFGYMVDRTNSSRTALIGATMVTILGQILYLLGPYVQNGIVVVLLSRLIVGFGTGTLSISRAFMVKICSPAELTRYISLNTLVQYAGFSFSPILPIMIGFGDERMRTVWAPSLLIIAMNLAVLLALLLFMSRYDPMILLHQRSRAGPVALDRWSRDEIAFVLFLFLNFALRGVVGIAETIAAAEHQRLNASDVDVIGDSAEFLLMLGVAGTVTFASLRSLEMRASSWSILLMGMCAILIGSMIMLVIADSLTAFIVGMVLVWSIGSPITQVLTISTYSQLMAGRPQGAIMAWLTTAGSVGRILLPMACAGSARSSHSMNAIIVTISIALVALFLMRSDPVSLSPKEKVADDI